MLNQSLPEKIQVYVNKDLILFPDGQIPIFFSEPKEVDFIEKIIRTKDRHLGIVQSLEYNEERINFSTGCLGRVVNFSELEDGYLVILVGLCRFDLACELDPSLTMHKAQVDYSRYEYDLNRKHYDLNVDRDRLLKALKVYMKEFDVSADWEEISQTPDDALVTALAMSGPFSPVEKQALMESVSLPEQCCIITALMEMATFESSSNTFQ